MVLNKRLSELNYSVLSIFKLIPSPPLNGLAEYGDNTDFNHSTESPDS